MPTGKVKKFFEDKGFGFITPDDGSDDVFVHRKVYGDGQDRTAYLEEGASVEYEQEWDDRKSKYSASSCQEPPPLGNVVNIQPQTRKERQAQSFREDLEKMRLRARRENYCVFEEGGVDQPKESLGYISEADRFVTDMAAVNKSERDAEFNKKEQMYYNRRMGRAENEEKRWRTIEMQHQLEQKRMEEMRANNSYARSNKTSMPYNPISLRYDDGHDGQRLRYSDDSLRYRGALRAEHLQRRMTSTGFNPLTGEPISRVHVPDAPNPPSH